jgi:hypothetical protein
MTDKPIQCSILHPFQRARLAITNRMIAWAGVIGIGLLPCPDCGLPLGVKLWPAAGIVWLFQQFRRRSAAKLDLLLMVDVTHSPDSERDS